MIVWEKKKLCGLVVEGAFTKCPKQPRHINKRHFILWNTTKNVCDHIFGTQILNSENFFANFLNSGIFVWKFFKQKM